MLLNIKRIIDGLLLRAAPLTASAWFRALLPVLLAAALSPRFVPGLEYFPMENTGGFLLAGLPAGDITMRMPFFYTAMSFLLNAGLSLKLVFAGLNLSAFALVFFAGCLLGGYRAGLLALAGAGLLAPSHSGFDFEQVTYSIYLLLVLCFFLLRRREDTRANGLLCALSIGASLLLRSPLLLLPVFAVLLDLARGALPPGALRRQLLFAGACYAMLLPWAWLNYSVSGKAGFMESTRADCNIITAALGSVYTIEGDPRRLAGLGPEDSAAGFFFREVSKRPFFHALTAARRLWHIFLFQPLLLGLFLLAMALDRGKESWPGFLLPVYFIALHSLFSVEVRYLYPLVYLLPPLVAGTFLRKLAPPDPRLLKFSGKAVSVFFAFFFSAALGVDALVAAYPARSSGNALADDTFARASARFPNEGQFHRLKCGELWRGGDDAAFRSCLAAYDRKFGDKVAGYFLAVISSTSPLRTPEPPRGGLPFSLPVYAVKMLRELELGDQAAARDSFYKVMDPKSYNYVRGEPYQKDREIARRLREQPNLLFDRTVANVLMFWPPQGMARILPRLEKMTKLTGRLAQMRDELRSARSAGADDRQLRRRLAAGNASVLDPKLAGGQIEAGDTGPINNRSLGLK